MRGVTRLLGGTGVLAAIAAAVELSIPAQAGRMGGFHGGMAFHGGFHDNGFHHHHRVFPRFGTRFGRGVLYGVYGWPGYGYYIYPSYDNYPYDAYYAYSYPYYGGGYPPPVPHASGYGWYPTPSVGFTDIVGAPIETPPQAEVRPFALQARPPDPLLGVTRRPPKPATSDKAADPRLPDVRLTGIVIDRDRRIAIFAVTGTRALVLSEGEALKEWRLDSISPQTVSLSGPAGSMTLALNADTNLAQSLPPAGPAAASP